MKRITASKARELDRAMALLENGRISYMRWVETLEAWTNGEDITVFDYGDAEPLGERIRRRFAGKCFTAQQAADQLGVSYNTAYTVIARAAKYGAIRRHSRGVWRAGT